MGAPHKLTVAEGLAQAERSLARGAFNEAVNLCRHILQVDGENAAALHMLAVVANRTGKPERALEILERALAARPDDSALLNTRGVILTALGHLDEAEDQLRACLDKGPTQREAWLNLATVKERGNDFAAALEVLDDLDGRIGADASSQSLRASVLQSRGDFEAALAALTTAEALAPDSTDIRFAKANLLLLLGRMAEGWPGFELRRHRALGRTAPIDRPTWSPTAKPGTRVLVYSEHGLGDVIQFARYVPYLIQRSPDVIFDCHAKLVPLMGTLSDPGTLIPSGDPIPDCDCVAPIMSLPYLLGHGLDQIADLAKATPYLSPDPGDVASIKAELDGGPGLKVGLAWQGNPNQSTDPDRSIPIAHFEGIMALEGITAVSLQKVHGERDIDPFKSRYRIVDWPHAKDDFYPLACLVRALDLVITSDTAIAHLAGALGARTWLLLSAKPSWRWLLQRDDSPWYPTMRLFRQATFRNWGPVFAAVESALKETTADRT